MIATSRSGRSLRAVSHLASATLTKASQSVVRDLFVFISNVSMVFVRCLASSSCAVGTNSVSPCVRLYDKACLQVIDIKDNTDQVCRAIVIKGS